MPVEPGALRARASTILHHPEQNWLYPLGRVRPGTNIPALQQKLSAALRNWLYTRPVYTEHGGSSIIPKQHVTIVPGGGGIQSMQQETGKGLKMLMILSSVVLLIACANIANLVLARSTTHRGDIAVRMALGASRTRVIRQIVTESVLLSCIGGLVGLAVAYMDRGRSSRWHFLMPGTSPSMPARRLQYLDLPSRFPCHRRGIRIRARMAVSHAQPAEVLRGVNRSTRDRSAFAAAGARYFSGCAIAGACLPAPF